MLDPATWAVLRDLGFGAIATIALVGGFRGWYVWRREFEAMRVDRDFWRAIAMKSIVHTDQALEVAGKVAGDG